MNLTIYELIDGEQQNVGTVSLDNGHLTFSDGVAGYARLKFAGPNHTTVTSADGELFLRTMAARLQNPYVSASPDGDWATKAASPRPLKYNPNHDPETGEFSSGDAPSGLGKLVHENGGFTIHASTGKVPHSGWMVSQAGAEKAIPAATLTPTTIKSYIDAHRAALRDPHAYLGAWYNPDDKHVYLDISDNIPDRDAAIKAGTERNQWGIFNAGTHEYLPLVDRSSQPMAASATVGDPTRNLHLIWLDPDDPEKSYHELSAFITAVDNANAPKTPAPKTTALRNPLTKYNPNIDAEPRDPHGRWTVGGGTAGTAPSVFGAGKPIGRTDTSMPAIGTAARSDAITANAQRRLDLFQNKLNVYESHFHDAHPPVQPELLAGQSEHGQKLWDDMTAWTAKHKITVYVAPAGKVIGGVAPTASEAGLDTTHISDTRVAGTGKNKTTTIVIDGGVSPDMRALALTYEVMRQQNPKTWPEVWTEKEYKTNPDARSYYEARIATAAHLTAAHYGLDSNAFTTEYVGGWLAGAKEKYGKAEGFGDYYFTPHEQTLITDMSTKTITAAEKLSGSYADGSPGRARAGGVTIYPNESGQPEVYAAHMPSSAEAPPMPAGATPEPNPLGAIPPDLSPSDLIDPLSPYNPSSPYYEKPTASTTPAGDALEPASPHEMLPFFVTPKPADANHGTNGILLGPTHAPGDSLSGPTALNEKPASEDYTQEAARWVDATDTLEANKPYGTGDLRNLKVTPNDGSLPVNALLKAKQCQEIAAASQTAWEPMWATDAHGQEFFAGLQTVEQAAENGVVSASYAESAHAIAQQSALTPQDADGYLKAWAYDGKSEQSNTMAAVHQAVNIEFGVDTGYAQGMIDKWSSQPGWDQAVGRARAFVRAQYAVTQNHITQMATEPVGTTTFMPLAGSGTGFSLMRGASFSASTLPPGYDAIKYGTLNTAGSIPAWQSFKVDQMPLSSWSVSGIVASQFTKNQQGLGTGNSHKYFYSAYVPRERILSDGIAGMGAAREGEMIVIGGKKLPVSVARIK